MIVVDRIEEGIAVLEENGERISVPLSELPQGIGEGCVLVKKAQGYERDFASEARLRKKIADKSRRLFKR